MPSFTSHMCSLYTRLFFLCNIITVIDLVLFAISSIVKENGNVLCPSFCRTQNDVFFKNDLRSNFPSNPGIFYTYIEYTFLNN